MLAALVKFAGIGMLAGLVATLAVCFVLDRHHFDELFADRIGSGARLAVTLGLLFQGLRLVSALGGVSEFAQGKQIAGGFGLAISLALTIAASYMYKDLAEAWATMPDVPVALSTSDRAGIVVAGANEDLFFLYNLILQLVLWVGFALEVRMILNVYGDMVPTASTAKTVTVKATKTQTSAPTGKP